MLSLPLLSRVKYSGMIPDVVPTSSDYGVTYSRRAEDFADAAFVSVEDFHKIAHREAELLTGLVEVFNLFSSCHVPYLYQGHDCSWAFGQVLRLAGGRCLTVFLCHLQCRL